MGRNAGAHAYCNAVRTVDQKIWHPYRKHCRLSGISVIVGYEIHSLIQILKIYILGEFLKPCLCITHCSGTVSFNGAEIAVTVHKRHSLLPYLTHDYQSLIDGRITVRMVFTHCIAYDTGRLLMRLVMGGTQLAHVIEHSSLYRLEAVPGIRDSS